MLEEAVWIKGRGAGYFDRLRLRSDGKRNLQVERLPGEQYDSVPLLRLEAGSAYLQLVGPMGRSGKTKMPSWFVDLVAADTGGGVDRDHGGSVTMPGLNRRPYRECCRSLARIIGPRYLRAKTASGRP